MNYAISATAEYDAELTLLHVLEEIPTAGSAQEAMATAAEQLDKLIAPDKRKMTKVKTEVRIGKRFIFAAEEPSVDSHFGRFMSITIATLMIVLSAGVPLFGTRCRLRQKPSPASDPPAQ